jgi:hypothetical protein
LTAPDWSNPTTLDFPFSFPEVEFSGQPDASQQGAANITLEGNNLDLGGARLYSDILAGYDPKTYDMHVRIGRKTDPNDSYVYRFWGVVNTDSIEITYGDFSNPDSWSVKFSASDSVTQLGHRTVKQYVDDILIHKNYDYKASQIYLDFIGTVGGTSGSIAKGAYQQLDLSYREDKRWRWYNGINMMPIESVLTAMDVCRWFRLSEILQSFSDYLGLGTNVNEGTSWGTLHTWSFGFNTAAAAATEAMTYVGLDQLYIFSGLWDGVASVYKHGGSLFDDLTDENDLDSPGSFYHKGSALDMLKNICVSLGMVFRIRANAAGDRYLQIHEATYFNQSVTIDHESIFVDAQQSPYERAIEGIQVNSPAGSDHKRGNAAQKSINLDTAFTSANNARDRDIKPNVGDMRMDNDVWYSLWASTATPSGSRGVSNGDALTLATIYSVSAIVPAVLGVYAPSTAYIEGSRGAYQSSAPFAINAVMYPNNAGVYCAWVEVPALALAHYWFSPYDSTKDIGVFRPVGRAMKMKVKGILDNPLYPGARVTIDVGGTYSTWIVTRSQENYLDNTMEIDAEYYTI